MTYALVLAFEGVTEEQYWAVNENLGVQRDGKGDWPAGILSHAGGPMEGGGWLVIERWDSKASQEAFMATRLGPALGIVGLPAPIHIFESNTVNDQQFG